MTKRTYYLLLLAVAVGLFSWLYIRKSVLFSERVFESPRPIEIVTTPTPASSPSPSPRLSGASTASPQNQNLNRQIQLADERARLTALQQNLQDLRTQQALLQQQAAATSNLRISQTQEQIQNLTDSLQDRRLAEDEINQDATAALREQSSAARLAREQLDEAIRQQQEIMQITQNQMYIASQDLVASLEERDARLADLQNAWNLQYQNLQDLRNQRVQVSSAILLQTRAISENSQNQRDQLANNTDATRGQIQSLRDEALRMQAVQNEARASLQALDSQIQQAQEQIQAQLARVKDLEAQLQNPNTSSP